jgi:hypothetical protein
MLRQKKRSVITWSVGHPNKLRDMIPQSWNLEKVLDTLSTLSEGRSIGPSTKICFSDESTSRIGLLGE